MGREAEERMQGRGVRRPEPGLISQPLTMRQRDAEKRGGRGRLRGPLVAHVLYYFCPPLPVNGFLGPHGPGRESFPCCAAIRR